MPCPITGEKHCKCLIKAPVTSDVGLKETLRKLFTDHVIYTHLFTNSSVDNIADAQVVLKRLLRNQVDIGDALGPIIGEELGQQVTDLLTEHIKRAGDSVKALLSGDEQAKSDAVEAQLAQGDDVAAALSSLNPRKIPLDVVTREFRHHNLFVVQLADLHLHHQYEEEVEVLDAYLNHMLSISDMLYQGLIAKY